MKLFKKNIKLILTGGLIVCIGLPLTLISCQKQDSEKDVTLSPVVNDVTPKSPKLPSIPVPPTVPISSSILELKKGGEIFINNQKSLQVDRFISIARKLELFEYLNISNLTNDILNNRLKDSEFNTLQLSILENSSQTKGVLALSIKGTFKGNPIVNETMNISGFINNDLNQRISFRGPANINKFNFINDLRDGDNIKNLSSQEFFKYNDEIFMSWSTYSQQRVNLSLNKLYENGFISNLAFKSTNLNGLEWNIDFDFVEKTYNAGHWIISNQKKLNLENYSVRLDVEKVALEILAENVVVKNNEDPIIFASTVFGKWKLTIAPFKKYIFLNEKIASKYFENSNEIKIDAQELNVDDTTGVLQGRFIISLPRVPRKMGLFSATIKNFKTSSSTLTEENLDISKNKLIITPNSRIEAGIIGDLVALKQQLTSLQIGSDVALNISNFPKSWRYLFESSDTLFDNHLNNSNKGVTLAGSLHKLQSLRNKGMIFNILGRYGSLERILAFQRLGSFENMLIDLISVRETQDQHKISVSKINGTDYKVSYKLDIGIHYYGGSQNITLKNEIVINLDSQQVVR